MSIDIEWQSEQYELGYPRLRAEFEKHIAELKRERDEAQADARALAWYWLRDEHLETCNVFSGGQCGCNSAIAKKYLEAEAVQ